MTDKPYVIFDGRTSWFQSTVGTILNFGMLAFCAWISQGSTWWIFITGLFFIFFVFVRMASIFQERNNRFRTTDEIRAWADKMDQERIGHNAPEIS